MGDVEDPALGVCQQSDHEQQQSAPRRGKVLEALARAERKVFTRPAPKSPKVQVKFLLRRVKGAANALAERSAVSRRAVERYRAGKLTTPQKRLQAVLVKETESAWQPQVRAQAQAQAATSGGMMVHVVASFGFTASGSSDDGRIRHITTPISPTHAARILRLQEAGATEEERHPVVADAVTESYFTEWGHTGGWSARGFHTRPVDRFRVLTQPNSGLTELAKEIIGDVESSLGM
ncbi:terminal protein [Streptomyces sp. NPDC088341]|uniref:telomere-protecting terminal protein Tpg n=1 Tax=Streptomyces sp. NPDC088341 TaxID=3154870 RepID=UPI00341F788D